MAQELQAREKMEVKPEGEHTRNIPVFTPEVDIYESEDSLTLLADIPGVEKENLSIDLRDNTLTLRGELKRQPVAGRRAIYTEYQEGDYQRQFSLSKEIDQDGITASLKDGVLTLILPKVQPAKPRQIQIKAD